MLPEFLDSRRREVQLQVHPESKKTCKKTLECKDKKEMYTSEALTLSDISTSFNALSFSTLVMDVVT
jgi:hypothetical protein